MTDPAAPAADPTLPGDAPARSEVTCPQCELVNTYVELVPHADNFCDRCDYPLFWDQHFVDVPVGDGTEEGIGRKPGVGGRDGRAMRPCPECAEPNIRTAVHCTKCTALMDPPPPPPPPKPAPAVVGAEWEPEPRRIDWVLVALVVLALALIAYLAWYGITA